MLGGVVFSAIPLLAFILWSRMATPDWRAAWVLAAIAWAAATAVLTEAFSLFHALRFWPVLLLWLMINFGLLGCAWRRARRPSWPSFESGWERFFAVMLAAPVALALAIAFVAPPNTPDVLAYHLPRQLMWLQQGGVQHFITSDERALMMPPLGEMIQAHALLLAGGDYWANFPQWFAYVLGLIVTSLLARELGAGRRAQWLAAFVFATIPMAWHEATSAKNDLLVAVWLGIGAWLALKLARSERSDFGDWLAVGAAFGVALATKTTALIFCVAPLALLLPAAFRDRRRAWVVPVLALLIVGPHAVRNLAWYGTPLGRQPAAEGGGQGSEVLSLRAAVSNFLRNATLHLATPSSTLNGRLLRFSERAHDWMGQDPNDRRTTLWFLRYGVDWGPQHEAIAGAPAHFVLGFGMLIVWLARRAWRGPPLRALLIAVLGVVLYCLALKWQPAGARLQLPIFIVLAALIAWAAEGLGSSGIVLVMLACVVAWLPASETQLRPWRTAPTVFAVPRWENYFRSHPRSRLYAENALAALARAEPATVQIVSRHGFPYPLMTRFPAVVPGAKLWGAPLGATVVPPQAVLVVEPTDRPFPPEFNPGGATEPYRAVGGLEPYALYLPAATATASPTPAR